MQSFALRFPSVAEWRGRLIPLALPLAMFVALLALGGDRWRFYQTTQLEHRQDEWTLRGDRLWDRDIVVWD